LQLWMRPLLARTIPISARTTNFDLPMDDRDIIAAMVGHFGGEAEPAPIGYYSAYRTHSTFGGRTSDEVYAMRENEETRAG
jgi:hypothetical protein